MNELQYVILNGRKIIARKFYLDALVSAHEEIEAAGIGVAGMFGFVTGAVATASWRSLDTQKQLKAIGASQTLESHHRRGMAVDCFPDHDYIDKITPIMNKHGLVNDLGPVIGDWVHWNFLSNAEGYKYGFIDSIPSDLTPYQKNMPKNPHLIKAKDDSKVYYTNSRHKFHIPDEYTFTELGFSFAEVTELPSVDQYITREPFPSLNPNMSPKTFNIDVKHESQGYYPICALISAVRMFEWHYEKQTGERKEFDVRVLYSELNGQGGGVNTGDMLDHMENVGLVELREDFDPYDKSNDWLDEWREYAETRKNDPRVRLLGREQVTSKVRTEAHREAMRAALEQYGPLMVTVNAKGKWYEGAQDDGSKWSKTHKILLTGWNEEYWLCNNAWDDKYKYPEMDYEYPFAFPTYFTGVVID